MATDQNSFAKAVLDPNADRAPLLIGFQENRALLLGAVDELQRLPLLASSIGSRDGHSPERNRS